MSERIKEVKSFGDVRLLILQTVIDVRDGHLSTSQAMAIAANMKELNANIQCEINATKLSIATDEKAKKFGEVLSMGRRLIGENAQVEDRDATIN
jgi:3,4-dihydroxy-2-butanone 4-phosphate synthase